VSSATAVADELERGAIVKRWLLSAPAADRDHRLRLMPLLIIFAYS